jgi:uncharacterized protein (TIGR03437 family)
MRILSVLLLVGASVTAHAGSFENVSAASGRAVVAPDSVAAAIGDGLAVAEMRGESMPLLTTLGGISVQVTDSTGEARLAGLYYVSAKQINYVVPAGTRPGTAVVNILSGGTPTGLSAPAEIQSAAPSLFSANADGKGVAAATAVRMVIATRIQTPVTVYQCGQQPGSCTGVPIDPGLDAPLYLSFFGTGFRGARTVALTIGGVDMPVLYAGPQPSYPGMDQINVPLILSLRGKGLVDVVLTADGVPSNPVQIDIQ